MVCCLRGISKKTDNTELEYLEQDNYKSTQRVKVKSHKQISDYTEKILFINLHAEVKEILVNINFHLHSNENQQLGSETNVLFVTFD